MRNPSLRHVYASLAEFNDALIVGGSTNLTDAGNNALKLEMLDEVSRLIDARAHRGSGFGPWVGTKSYDGRVVRVIDPHDTLWLRADLSALDSLSILSTVSATPITPTVETDFYLAGLGGYEAPFRKIILNGLGTPLRFGHGRRVTSVTGTWSYLYRTRVLSVTTAEVLDTSETGVDVSALTGLSPGMTLLIGSEQMYVTATTAGSPNTITVERGVNGTTATTHITASPITRYVYDASVHTCALRLAERRWTSRDAGADGSDGGGDVGLLSPHEGEDTIIRRMLGATIMLSGQV